MRPDSSAAGHSFSPAGPRELISGRGCRALSGRVIFLSLWELRSVSQTSIDAAKTMDALIRFVNAPDVSSVALMALPCVLLGNMHVCGSPMAGVCWGGGFVPCLPQLSGHGTVRGISLSW